MSVGRDYTVFCDDILHAGEGATVRKRMFEEPRIELVVDRLLRVVDHGLEEEVRLLQLIIEKVVGLRKLEAAHLEAVDGIGTHYVKSRKEPATAARTLICNAF